MRNIYSMELLDQELCNKLSGIDCLLVSGGSDYRTYESMRKLKECKVEVAQVILFDFEERTDGITEDELKKYEQYCSLGFNIKQISCSLKDPSSCLKEIANSALQFPPEAKIALDISCFTKPYFCSILKFFKDQIQLRDILVFYTEPQSYSLSGGYYKSYHSTDGTLEVIEIPGFTGNQVKSSHTVLIILVGFDGELSSFIYDEISPKEVIVVNGFPSYAPGFKDISLINNERLIDGNQNTLYYSCANNPFDTYNLLEHLRMKRKEATISVAALGTKPMALGACLFAIMNPSVRLVYPLPSKYTNVTTQQCFQSWAYKIPLS